MPALELGPGIAIPFCMTRWAHSKLRNLTVALVTITVGQSLHAHIALAPSRPAVDRELVISAPMPARPRVVNFVSGVPLVNSDDPTGGFGDVAANITGAIEFKRRNTDITVNLLMTSYKSAGNAGKTILSDDIIQIMFPQIDSKIPTGQILHGVNVIFIKEDVIDLKNPGASENKDLQASLAAQIPASDLSIQLSANKNPIKSILEMRSKLVLSFHELDGEQEVLQESSALPHGESPQAQISLNSGPLSTGFYFSATKHLSVTQDLLTLNHWLRQVFQTQIDEQTEIAFAYNKEAEVTRLYATALTEIAIANPEKRYALFAKPFDSSGVEIPPNLDIYQPKGFPYEIINTLIRISTLSPTVNGDSTLSMALGSTTDTKSVLYEWTSWKTLFVSALTKLLGDRIGMTSDSLTAQMVIWTLGDRPQTIQRIKTFLLNNDLHSKIHKAIASQRTRLDLTDNLLKIYDFYRLYQNEWDNGIYHIDFFNFVLKQFIKHRTIERAVAAAGKTFRDKSAPQVERAWAAFLYLKFKNRISHSDQIEFWNVINETLVTDEVIPFEQLAVMLSTPGMQAALAYPRFSDDKELKVKAKRTFETMIRKGVPLTLKRFLEGELQRLSDHREPQPASPCPQLSAGA